ncbi:MAG: hypothetical protein NT004_12035, partial [Bacteroidetes bacterium]|nr:hypothetical protein [Bacteroidota bacterium]
MKHLSVKSWQKLLIIPAFIFISLVAGGQKNTVFSGDSTKFVGELNAIFFNMADNEKKIIAPFMEDFIQKWNQEQFGASKKKIIYSITNEMARKKIRLYPDFFNYINALNIFVNSHQLEATFNPWSEILLKLLSEKNSRKFLSFLESSSYFFAENLLYKSSTTRWKIIAPSYRFSFDTVPKITFPESGLICYASDDSMNVYATKGVYYPLTSMWKGNGGRVNWKRAGEDPEKVFANLADYEIQMRFPQFTADSVQFMHRKFFPSPIVGRYSDKALSDVAQDKISYPQFYSYNKMIGIKRLFDNIDFLGGFAIEGSRIIGSGDKTRDARLFFKKDGKDFVIAGSNIFVIRPDRINSGMASVTIYHDQDSIFHPGLQLKYLDAKKELAFAKDERIPRISPWFDSYHQIEIYCEALYWNVGEPRVSFQMMKGPTKEGKAVFESSSYYSLSRYEKLQGIDEFNPLNLIKTFTEKRKSREFTLEELTNYLKLPTEQIENQLLNLAIRGFLIYDPEDKVAIVKQKLYDYVTAFIGKSDYDGIFFNSFVSNTANGLLNLETFDLTVKGIDMVALSDSQQVRVYPANKEVILKKDMDFTFSGKIEAGLFDFYATDCSFEYNKFRMNLPAIDSMLFYVPGKTRDPKTGLYSLIRVKTAINNLSGYLLIDDPLNKSGLKVFPQYPVFSNKSNAFVNWNKN